MIGRPGRPLYWGLVVVLALVPLACGGGGGGGGGGAGSDEGENTLVKNVSTPLGSQGNLGESERSGFRLHDRGLRARTASA